MSHSCYHIILRGFLLSEIAFEMNYSSVAYLSAQLKKETGMTPTEFKMGMGEKRVSLDDVREK